MEIGTFTLDTLQIYFPWDDDLYTYMKERGFGKSGFGKKALPLIYTDNCISTEGKKEIRRKFVIEPAAFKKTHKELGWKETDKKSEPIIPAEKIKVKVSLENGNSELKFKILPRDKQYHLEYSSRAEFGKLYSNWVTLYFTIDDFKKIYNKIKRVIKYNKNSFIDFKIHKESQQNKREEFEYIEIPVIYYEFSLEEFKYAKDYIVMNGFVGQIPILYYDLKDDKCELFMQPKIKFVVIHTTGKEGFSDRQPQNVIKIAQDKIMISKRGKRAKLKGFIDERKGENYFVLNTTSFIQSANKLIDMFKKKYPRQNIFQKL